MLGWAFLGCVTISIVCWLVVSWVDFYLFAFLGIDEEGNRYFMYDLLSIPARIVAFLIAVIIIYATFYSWFNFVTTFIL